MSLREDESILGILCAVGDRLVANAEIVWRWLNDNQSEESPALFPLTPIPQEVFDAIHNLGGDLDDWEGVRVDLREALRRLLAEAGRREALEGPADA